jgi:anti-sigma-K factor RskA
VVTGEGTRNLLAARALGALPPEESARVDRAVAENAGLALELEEHRQTVSVLEGSVAREVPTPGLFERILAEVEPARHAPAARAEDSPRWWRRGWRLTPPRLVLAGAAAVLLGVLVGVLVTRDGGLGTPAAEATLAGEGSDGVKGEALLYGPDRPAGTLVVKLDGVPAPPEGRHYEVWVLRKGSEAMEAVGSFSPSGRDVELDLPLPGPGDYRAVDVSLEEDGGPAAHSGHSLAGGRFTS